MKKLFLTASTGLIVALAACSNSTSESDPTDTTQQEGSIPAGDQSGTNDRMNNTSDNPGSSSSTRQPARGTGPGNNDPGSDKLDDHRYQPMPGMDTTQRNPKNNGDSRRMVIEQMD